jgi:arsenate reductase
MSPPTPRQRRWAFVRLALGYAQTTGSVTTAILLCAGGVSPVALVSFAITTSCSLASVILFRIRRVQEEPASAPAPWLPCNPFSTANHMKTKVLFVCIHNSARSQMAEAFLNRECPAFFEAHSAGLEPGALNPLVVEAMREVGIDISGHPTKSVFDVFRSGMLFSHVIAVCDGASAERCPIFPGVTTRLHWSFPDPSALTGTREEKMAGVRVIRDTIEQQVREWCGKVCVSPESVA